MARAMVIVLFVAAIAVAGQATVRSTYPFLEMGALRPPDILYDPTLFPPSTHPLGFELRSGSSGVDLEWRQADESRHLLIWETTRPAAKVEQAIGAYDEGGPLRGRLVTWHAARSYQGWNVLYARLNLTLVVIAGDFPTADLLDIADSLRPTTPSRLML